MEALLDALHQTNAKRLPIHLEFAHHTGVSAIFCRFPHELRSAVMEQLADAYPDCKIDILADGWLASRSPRVMAAGLRLGPDIFPIKTHEQFEDTLNRNAADPVGGILSLLRTSERSRLETRIIIRARPAAPRRYRQAQAVVDRLQQPFPMRCLANWYARAATHPGRTQRLCAFAISKFTNWGRSKFVTDGVDGKIGRHLFETHIQLIVGVPQGKHKAAIEKVAELAGSFGRFTTQCVRFRISQIQNRPIEPRGPGFLLSAAELATIWHPPTSTVRAAKLPPTRFRELEPPVDLPNPAIDPDGSIMGTVRFRRQQEPFGIMLDDRRRHLAIIGKTGMGKSTLLHRLIASDIQAGRGVGLIDPHGDLAEAILASVPRQRTNDVVLFDAGDRAFPVAFNPLDCREPEQRPLVASGVVSAFKKLYGDSWGPRLEHIFRNALLALIEQPGASLASVMRLLNDAGYRRQVVDRVSDPLVRSFWQDEFARWKPNFQAEAVAPIQNKVGQFLSHPVLRAIVGQPRSSINLRAIMDEGSVLIVNLSKGRIGEDASTLLGSLLVTELQLAAMSRADVPEEERRDFFAYVDEFQNFATESFATILSEARKYRLSLTIANQYLAQMEEQTMEAVFGNVGSLLAFQVGARDAETIAEQIGGDTTPSDLMNLPKFTAYLRLLINGMPSRPFSMQTLPASANRKKSQRPEVIRRTSRNRYGQPVGKVREQVERAFTAA